MKKIIPFYLYPNYFKYVGLALCIGGLFLLLILGSGYQLVIYFGLILVVFAKEKEDTELVVKIRAESYKTVFGYLLAIVTALYLVETIYNDFEVPWSPLLLLGLPLILYVVYFNLLLIINSGGKPENSRGSVTGYILWIVLAGICTVVLVFKFLG